jgi:glycosyltransferase involved in cell wall biosynthesis
MNSDVARRFRYAKRVVVEPNFALGSDELVPRDVPHSGPKVAVFVGRLLSWKGTRLAVSALGRPEAADWELHFYGNGPDRPHLERLAARLGVTDRVKFVGRQPRADVIAAMARAHAMLFPSMHDSAGWVVGEATSVGCPVVCLDIGGPPLMADVNAHVVGLRGDVVGGIARALAQVSQAEGVPSQRWSVDRLPDMTRRWYELATE